MVDVVRVCVSLTLRGGPLHIARVEVWRLGPHLSVDGSMDDDPDRFDEDRLPASASALAGSSVISTPLAGTARTISRAATNAAFNKEPRHPCGLAIVRLG